MSQYRRLKKHWKKHAERDPNFARFLKHEGRIYSVDTFGMIVDYYMRHDNMLIPSSLCVSGLAISKDFEQ